MPEKVTVVVMAFNEEKYIRNVLQPLKEWKVKNPANRNVVIVDDGSTDTTAEIAKKEGFTVLKSNPRKGKNVGKGKAFVVGANFAKRNESDILVTLDADMKILRPNQIETLVNDLNRSTHKMMIGLQIEGDAPITTAWITKHNSGQRAIKMDTLTPLFKKSPKWKAMLHGYGLETALEHLIPNFGWSEVVFRTAPPHRKSALRPQYKDISKVQRIIHERNTLYRELNDLRKSGKKNQARKRLRAMQRRHAHLR